MRIADLNFRRQRRPFAPRSLGEPYKRWRRPAVRKPVVATRPPPPELLCERAAFEVVLHDSPVGESVREFADPVGTLRLRAWLVEPADELRLRVVLAHSSEHRPDRLAVDFPLGAVRAARAVDLPAFALGGQSAQAVCNALAVADINRPREIRNVREYVGKRLLNVLQNLPVRGAHRVVVAPAARAAPVRVRLEKALFVSAAQRRGLDEKQPRFDSVSRALADGFFELCEPLFRERVALCKRRFREVAQFDRQPQPVDSLAREPVEVFVGVVVYIVEQFVAVERRAFYRAEETPRYAVFEPRFALDRPVRQKRPLLRGNALFEKIYGSAQSLRILRDKLDSAFADGQPIAFSPRDFPAL